MSFRGRLTAALVAAVAVPVVLAALVALLVLPANSGHRVAAEVGAGRAQAEASLRAACAHERGLATTLAAVGGGFDGAVTTAAGDPGSAAVLLDPAGTSVASGARAGTSDAELVAAVTQAADCATGGVGGARVVAARVSGAGGRTAVVGLALDPSLAGGTSPTLFGQTQQAAGTDLTLALPAGRPAVSTIHETDVAGRLAALALGPDAPSGLATNSGVQIGVLPLSGGAALVVSRPVPGVAVLVLTVLLVGLLVLAVAALLGWRLARAAVRPLTDLSAAAERVTEGDLDFRLPNRGADEVGRLSLAFNTMTEALKRTITDLRASRDELQRNVSRLGDTLAGTHDLDRILGVIVDTAMVSVRATAGALMLVSASGDQLYLRVGRGMDGRLPSSGPGSDRRVLLEWADGAPGVAARVAVTGEGLYGRVGDGGGLLPATGEPEARTVLATALRSAGRVTGVLALYDRADGQPFDGRDLQIVDSFTAQAVTAVDNVLLHQEAQRLSITDGLTGLWNYRYAILALTREVERAVRFGRPLAVLMLDLDRFKRVNDRYGHQRGDAVLVEVANRVRSVVREVDILARYGGEELILIGPETDLAGAEALAAKIRDAIRASPVGEEGETPLVMTASLGIATYPDHGEGARELLRAADTALYAAKAAGRDCWRIAGRHAPVLPGDRARAAAESVETPPVWE